MTPGSIKSMKLYVGAERIYNDLRALGIAADEHLDIDTVSRFDQYHYHGTSAVDEAIVAAAIGSTSRILEIGSGLGGPARHLAARTGCRVTALELQNDLHQVAINLTRRCGLMNQIDHWCGDVRSTELGSGVYDAVVSWLSLYHVSDHPNLFGQIAKSLASGGILYVEDLHRIDNLKGWARDDVETMLYGKSLLSVDSYLTNVCGAGFEVVSFEDLTQDWTSFCTNRLGGYLASQRDSIRVHGKEIVEGLTLFYKTVERLFTENQMGGHRLIGRKP